MCCISLHTLDSTKRINLFKKIIKDYSKYANQIIMQPSKRLIKILFAINNLQMRIKKNTQLRIDEMNKNEIFASESLFSKIQNTKNYFQYYILNQSMVLQSIPKAQLKLQSSPFFSNILSSLNSTFLLWQFLDHV